MSVNILLHDEQSPIAEEVALPVQHRSVQDQWWAVSAQDYAALFDGNPLAYLKGCTFPNCSFQISSNQSNADDFSNINIQDFLDN